jgi:hypothetical protein
VIHIVLDELRVRHDPMLKQVWTAKWFIGSHHCEDTMLLNWLAILHVGLASIIGREEHLGSIRRKVLETHLVLMGSNCILKLLSLKH